MHMHFYCYVIGGIAYLLDRGKEWCHSDFIAKGLVKNTLGDDFSRYLTQPNEEIDTMYQIYDAV